MKLDEILKAIDQEVDDPTFGKKGVNGFFHKDGGGMKRLVVPMEFKGGDKPGTFSGYASIFENVDLGGDVVKRGAFKEIVTNQNGQVKILFSHDMRGHSGSGGLPLGLAEVEQNSKGLKFDGSLVMDDPFVTRVHTHMLAGTLDGMSIGFDILPGGAQINDSGVRELTALKLWEISPVVFGMNPKASITGVKAIDRINDVRELEELLRDAVGLSRAQAKAHAGAIWGAKTGQRDADGEDSETLRRVTSFLGGRKFSFER